MVIKSLDVWTISQIRSGEVIKNYYDVVKELVENSIDASARNINLYILNDEIKISDDGIGMNLEDLLICLNSHATSKFKGLNNIDTLGFRGEGLHAISTVSEITLQSRYEEDVIGHEIDNKGNIKNNITRNVGTEITVKNLFYNIKARRMYINMQKDFIKIINYLENLSIAYDHIAFRIYRNNRHYLLLHHNVRIGGIDKEELKSYHIHDSEFTLKMYIPKYYKKTKKFVSFFVNNRWVKDFGIYEALKKHLFRKFNINNLDFLVVFLNIKTAHIDVNVSANKTYIEVFILDKILEAIDKYFNISPTINNHQLKDISYKLSYLPPKVIFNYKNKYVFMDYEEKIHILDIHAISEKVLFLQLKQNEFTKQVLLDNISIYLTESDLLALENKYDLLNKWFSFSIIGNYLMIKEIPNFMNVNDVENNVFYILSVKNMDYFDKILSEIACKNAIKSGDPVTEEEIIRLFQHTLMHEDYQCCNHGRNVSFVIDEKFLNKKFQRE